jgi:nitrite reductase/ring-hydroxylating ferredoxin subunit
MTRHRLCRLEDVAPGNALRIEPPGLPPLAVYNVDGEIFVTDDTCSHGKASLADGYLEGDEIECPWHAGRFCVRTGRATSLPAAEAVRSWPVEVDGGEVFVRDEPSPSS